MSGRLRIVAGEFGGRLIACPSSVARPTTDRVREAVFSSITSILGSLEGAVVCDAFAGSGALGLEALSRGAAFVQLFDADKDALACVKDNVAALKAGSAAHVARRDVLAAGVGGGPGPYDLVLLDPPYATPAQAVGELLAQAASAGELAEGCLIVYERASDGPELPESFGFELIRQKRYGKTAVDILRYESAT